MCVLRDYDFIISHKKNSDDVDMSWMFEIVKTYYKIRDGDILFILAVKTVREFQIKINKKFMLE